MKIYYQNFSSRKMQANVWVNDQQYHIMPGGQLDVKVVRGDQVTYKVGRFSATKPIKFQSPEAAFSIETDKRVQGIYIMGLLVLVLGLWAIKESDTIWATLLVVAVVIGYVAVNYFRGYTAKPVH